MQTSTKYDLTVKVHRRFHRGAIRLFLHFEIHKEMQRLVRNELNGRWSQTHKGWYVDDTSQMKDRIIAVCKGRAWYNMREINLYLDPDAKSLVQKKETASPSEKKTNKTLGVNRKDFDAYIHKLKARGYSPNTIGTYGGMIRKMAQHYPDQLIRNLNMAAVHQYLSSQVYDQKKSNSYHRQVVGALKLFYSHIESGEWDILSDLVYPAKHYQLPKVISESDVIAILRTTRNIKHKLAFAMLYSCGLRISELINLKINEIDIERRTVFVRRSKGFKDRVVMLAESVIPLLQAYLQQYQPVEYLLNGQGKLKYSANSVRKSLHNARLEAGVTKKVTPHILRHSFATHLMEQGVGIRYIQELLGHDSPKTTMVYTYVANDQLSQISSPLDHIVGKIDKDKNNDNDLPKIGE